MMVKLWGIREPFEGIASYIGDFFTGEVARFLLDTKWKYKKSFALWLDKEAFELGEEEDIDGVILIGENGEFAFAFMNDWCFPYARCGIVMKNGKELFRVGRIEDIINVLARVANEAARRLRHVS